MLPLLLQVVFDRLLLPVGFVLLEDGLLVLLLGYQADAS